MKIRVPCPHRLDPPLTLDEARTLVEINPAFDDRYVQADNYIRVLQRTGVCWCAQCRKRRGEKP
jgi:hypothetical protein